MAEGMKDFHRAASMGTMTQSLNLKSGEVNKWVSSPHPSLAVLVFMCLTHWTELIATKPRARKVCSSSEWSWNNSCKGAPQRGRSPWDEDHRISEQASHSPPTGASFGTSPRQTHQQKAFWVRSLSRQEHEEAGKAALLVQAGGWGWGFCSRQLSRGKFYSRQYKTDKKCWELCYHACHLRVFHPTITRCLRLGNLKDTEVYFLRQQRWWNPRSKHWETLSLLPRWGLLSRCLPSAREEGMWIHIIRAQTRATPISFSCSNLPLGPASKHCWPGIKELRSDIALTCLPQGDLRFHLSGSPLRIWAPDLDQRCQGNLEPWEAIDWQRQCLFFLGCNPFYIRRESRLLERSPNPVQPQRRIFTTQPVIWSSLPPNCLFNMFPFILKARPPPLSICAIQKAFSPQLPHPISNIQHSSDFQTVLESHPGLLSTQPVRRLWIQLWLPLQMPSCFLQL